MSAAMHKNRRSQNDLVKNKDVFLKVHASAQRHAHHDHGTCNPEIDCRVSHDLIRT